MQEWWGARDPKGASFLTRSGMAMPAVEVHQGSGTVGPYRVVLGVVNVHGRGVHVGLQRRVVIGKSGQFKGHGDGLGELQQHKFDRLVCPNSFSWSPASETIRIPGKFHEQQDYTIIRGKIKRIQFADTLMLYMVV